MRKTIGRIADYFFQVIVYLKGNIVNAIAIIHNHNHQWNILTIRHADEIIVLKKGEIVERGIHDELVALNGVYKRLQDKQSFE